ncbi:hypothetical protein CKO28_04690 [Rhodovibrio sodomensis]|uniref:Uncharacterized protein n=1 Tax=Rhodovibrio sodomensis TaxID=1088 RepID=A0ABS1DD49_9PROT|nr:hypothetical protein [Rhodovibrio sodomensis]MBK1667325.1 hypothetical protein [Rhodovibrio sodomensis]
MATLLAVYAGSRLIGRCDARCYEAKSHSCKCVCFGANHGAGYDRALRQTQQNAERWLARYLEKEGLDPKDAIATGRGLTQLEMDLADSGAPSSTPALSGVASGSFWTVYEHPSDLSSAYAARRWRARDGRLQRTDELICAQTLGELRARLPEGLVHRTRGPGDPANVLEVWTAAERA